MRNGHDKNEARARVCAPTFVSVSGAVHQERQLCVPIYSAIAQSCSAARERLLSAPACFCSRSGQHPTEPL